MLPSVIYHICALEEWEKAQTQGFYTHPSLEKEGFIHCSEERQVGGVLERYFPGTKDLLKLVIATEKVRARLQYDWSPSTGDSFPHIYGTLNLDAVVNIVRLQKP